MPRINTPRAGRKKATYFEDLIHRMYQDERVIARTGFGVCALDPQYVINTFNAVRNSCYKKNLIKVHCMEIYLEKEAGMDGAYDLATVIGTYFYEHGFQSLVNIADVGNCYAIVFAINSVSYLNGYAFGDNNTLYIELCNYLNETTPYRWNYSATECTIFDPEVRDGNYRRGMYT